MTHGYNRFRVPVRSARSYRIAFVLSPVGSSVALFDLLEEFREVYIGVRECAFECVTINFAVEGEHYPPSVGVFHLDVAASAMNLHEAETLQRSQYLPAGEQR